MPCCFCKPPPCDYGAPLGWDFAPGIRFLVRRRRAPRWVEGPGRGAVSSARQRLGQGGNEAGPTGPSPPPSEWSGQLQPAGRVPSDPGDQPRTAERAPGSRRTCAKLQPPDWTGDGDLGQIRQSGPRCLRRARSNPRRQPSLLGTFGRANHPYGQPGQQGIVPPGFLWLEILANPDNTAIITGAGAGKDPLQHPPEILPKLLTGTPASSPSISATVRG